MVCEHLRPLEQELLAQGINVTFRGQAWSQNCREWVYFDCYLACDELEKRFQFPECVQRHEHRGTHDGSESGFVCTECHDGVMGIHESMKKGKRIFR